MAQPKVERISIPGENQYIPKTKDQIRQIALDNLAGTIYGSWQLAEHDKDIVSVIFLPLSFTNDFHFKGWQRDEITHFYGHIADSLNRSINGRPIFSRFDVINDTDLKRVFKMQKRLSEIEEEDE